MSILSVVCNEPESIVCRHIYPMQLTPENLKVFWERARKLRTIFANDVNGDFKRFMEIFVSQDNDGQLRSHGLFWIIDDFVGVYYLTNITGIEAKAHYMFFDRRHRGREELTREMLRYVFRRYGFWRLTVDVPMYASKSTFGFVTALGFKKEGRKRKAIEYKGERFDVATFGILREDLLTEDELKWDSARNIKKLAADLQQDSLTTSFPSFKTA
jgi:RimJ/RimL family protein N-acetyltransferase